MQRRCLFVLFAFTCVSALAAPTASAQNSVIQGIVRDISGEPIGEAIVTAENSARDQTATSTTDNNGRFSFIALTTGQWLFTIEKPGYKPTQGFARVRRSGDSGRITLTLEINPLDPPVPTTGLLAGIRAEDIQANVDAAHELFDTGDFDGAISAYDIILKMVPRLTSLNLQIGHAYREKRDYNMARIAYSKVPAESVAGTEAELAIQEIDTLGATR